MKNYMATQLLGTPYLLMEYKFTPSTVTTDFNFWFWSAITFVRVNEYSASSNIEWSRPRLGSC